MSRAARGPGGPGAPVDPTPATDEQRRDATPIGEIATEGKPFGALGTIAARGALLTVGAGLCARVASLVATLALTHLIAPEVFGEVALATIVVFTANQISTVGFGQFVVARPYAGRDAVFHATAFNLGFAVLALAGVLAGATALAPVFGAPGMAAYVPGLVLATIIQRAGFIPQRVLARDMRFGTAAIGQATGEGVYALAAVVLAAGGLGGHAIVWGNVARSVVASVVFLAAVDPRDWLTPCRLRADKTLELFRFGVPIAVAALASSAARRWDSVVFSALFGPRQMGMYSLAYNLADVPAIHVGEHIGDVLLPSFARLPPERRALALARSSALLALLVFPLGVGLGAVAPTLVDLLFNDEWQGVAPYLVLLSALSVTRPLGWTISSYLQARDLPGLVMRLELFKLVGLLSLVAGLGLLGPLAACAGVGVAFGLHSLVGLLLIARRDAMPVRPLLARIAAPLLACAPLAAAVLAARAACAGLGLPTPASLAVEIAAGALAYVAAALKLAPATTRSFLDFAARGLGRRRG